MQDYADAMARQVDPERSTAVPPVSRTFKDLARVIGNAEKQSRARSGLPAWLDLSKYYGAWASSPRQTKTGTQTKTRTQTQACKQTKAQAHGPTVRFAEPIQTARFDGPSANARVAEHVRTLASAFATLLGRTVQQVFESELQDDETASPASTWDAFFRLSAGSRKSCLQQLGRKLQMGYKYSTSTFWDADGEFSSKVLRPDNKLRTVQDVVVELLQGILDRTSTNTVYPLDGSIVALLRMTFPNFSKECQQAMALCHQPQEGYYETATACNELVEQLQLGLAGSQTHAQAVTPESRAQLLFRVFDKHVWEAFSCSLTPKNKGQRNQ